MSIAINFHFYGPWGILYKLATRKTFSTSAPLEEVLVMIEQHTFVKRDRIKCVCNQRILNDRYKKLHEYTMANDDTVQVTLSFSKSALSATFLKQFLYSQEGAGLCFICMDQSADSYLVPCNHDSYCSDCALKLKECALCRKPIQDIYLKTAHG